MPAPTALKQAEDAPLALDVPLPVEGNDEEFLLDAPDALPTDADVLVPVEESNENGMAIDEEGRPRFAPARDIDPVTRVETRKIPIPPHRMTPLKQSWTSIYPPLVEHLKLQCRMNIKRKTIELRSSKHTTDTGALQKRDYLFSRLERLASKYPAEFQNLRGKGQGTFIAFDNPRRDEFLKRAKSFGINIGGSGASAVRLRPMLIFQEKHADILLDALEKIVASW